MTSLLLIFLFGILGVGGVVAVKYIRSSLRKEFEQILLAKQERLAKEERERVENDLAATVATFPKPRRYTPRFEEEHLDEPEITNGIVGK
jgi:hypothetical protein